MNRSFLAKVAFFLVIIFVFSICSYSGRSSLQAADTIAAENMLLGDADGDGRVTVGDARLVLRTSANLQENINTVVCDIDNDNQITSMDARYILRAAASLEVLICVKVGHIIVNGTCANCYYTPEETSAEEPTTVNIVPLPEASAQEISIAYETFEEINRYRESLGLYPFEYNPVVSRHSQLRALEVSETWSHTRPDGRDFWSVFEDYGMLPDVMAGEILANIGAPDPARAVTGWINSPLHHALLVNTKYTDVGVGVYIADNGRCFFCVNFIKEM